MFIVIAGNPVDGFHHWGPFWDANSATFWAENNLGEEWWLADLGNVDK